MKDSAYINDHWRFVSDGKEIFENELARELVVGHRLFGVRVRVIAARNDKDDALFELIGALHPYAQVHLTWSGKPETPPDRPQTWFFDSWEEWLETLEKANA